MKTILLTFSIVFSVVTINPQNSIQLSDFSSIVNTSWEGTLTHRDYQSGQLETVDATMQFKIEGDKIITNVQYTYELNKNHKGSVKIKKNGTYFGNEKVVSFKEENVSKPLLQLTKEKTTTEKQKCL